MLPEGYGNPSGEPGGGFRFRLKGLGFKASLGLGFRVQGCSSHPVSFGNSPFFGAKLEVLGRWQEVVL